MRFDIRPYTVKSRTEWDATVKASRNGTFLHQRDFMEYHADRFLDISVLVFNEREKCVAVMPANRVHDVVLTHGGLTYGGLLYLPELKQSFCIGVLEKIIQYYREKGVKSLIYKPVPAVFQRFVGQEDLYAIWRLGGRLVRRDVSTVVDLKSCYRFSKGRVWAIKKAYKAGVQIRRHPDLAQFYCLLQNVLSHHNAYPTHSKAELELLMRRFPDEIQLYGAVLNDQLLAAALVFDTGKTVHTQYLANSTEGRVVCALDILIENLIKNEFCDKNYLSFGISTEQDGFILNDGLISQKESFGGSSICHDFYEILIN